MGLPLPPMPIPPSDPLLHQTPRQTGDLSTILVVHPDLFGGPVHVPYLASLARNLPQFRFVVATSAPRISEGEWPPNVSFLWRRVTRLDEAERKLPVGLGRVLGMFTDFTKAVQYRRIARGQRFDAMHLHVGLEVENLMRVGRRFHLKGLWNVARWLSDFHWTNRPVLFTDHSLFTRRSDLGFPNPLHEADMSVTLAQDNVICVEREGQAYLSSHDSRMGVVRRSWYVPNGIDTERFAFKPLESRKALRIGYVGRIFRAGESRTFLPLLASRLPEDVELHLAVSSRQTGTEVRDLWFAGSRVSIERNVPNREMPRFYWSVDLVVNPMIWAALGRTTLEAMSCGRPVLMFGNTDRHPVTEATGYLAAVDDVESVLKLLNRLRDARDELALRGRNARDAIVREFDERRVAEVTGSIYSNLIKDQTRSGGLTPRLVHGQGA